MIECCIFDLDGTLVDSMFHWASAPIELISSKGKQPSSDLSDTFLSMSLPESCKYMKEYYNLEESPEELAKEIDDIMEAHYMNDVHMRPMMEKLLEELSRRGIKMAIASATDTHLIKKVLDKLQTLKYFDFIVSSTEVGTSKKRPDIYMMCSDHFNIPYSNTMVFEDLPYGIISSSRAGFHTVGVYDEPSIIHQDRIKANAEYYFESLDESFIGSILGALDK